MERKGTLYNGNLVIGDNIHVENRILNLKYTGLIISIKEIGDNPTDEEVKLFENKSARIAMLKQVKTRRAIIQIEGNRYVVMSLSHQPGVYINKIFNL